MKNRLLYCGTLASSLIFYIYYYNWASEFLFTALLLLPLFSLLVSLPAMLCCRLTIVLPAFTHCGGSAQVRVQCASKALPCGCVRATAQLQELSRQETARVKVRLCARQQQPISIDTAHCGCVEVSVRRARVFDYLGLFSIPVPKPAPKRIVLLPVPQQPTPLPRLSDVAETTLQPKHGGFAEAHEIREFRDGDLLRDVHWKMTAKMDKLMLREAMEPAQSLYLLTFAVTEAPAVNDGIFCRLLWVGLRLLQEQLPFSIRYYDTQSQLCTVAITDADDLQAFFAALLQQPVCKLIHTPPAHHDAIWHYHAAQQTEVAP